MAPPRGRGPLSPDAADDLAERGLSRYGAPVLYALLARIPGSSNGPWLYDLVRAYPARPAKLIRPALCLATCEAFGGRAADVLLPAVALEMFHNAFLIHDDLADGSQLRRGEPTLHAAAGAGLALNAGDALAVLAHRALRDGLDRYGALLADRVAEEFHTMLLRTVEGQAVELGWCRDLVVDLTPEDYLDLIMGKTSWYTTIHPLRVGALVATGGSADVSPMVRFGFHLGAAFQIRDDLLNLVGDEHAYGKEILGDLREGKRTLMLIHLIGAARGADRELLVDYLATRPDERGPDLLAEVRRLMDVYGSIDFAVDYAAGIAAAARDSFVEAFAGAVDNDARRFVEALIPYMLERAR